MSVKSCSSVCSCCSKCLFLHGQFCHVANKIHCMHFLLCTSLQFIVWQTFFMIIDTRHQAYCAGHFVRVPLHLTYLHCLQHSFFDISSIYIRLVQLSVITDSSEKAYVFAGVIKTLALVNPEMLVRQTDRRNETLDSVDKTVL